MGHSSAMDISGTPIRAVRAALFTAVVVTLSVASHVLLSGVPLPLSTTAVVTVGVFVLAFALAGRRERGFGRIAALLVPLELASDTVFTAGQHVCYGRAGGPVTGALRSVGLDVLCRGDVGTPLAGMAAGPQNRAAALLADATPGTPWLLLAAHIGIGLFAAAWLWRGERALGQLLRAVAVCTFRPLLIAVAAVTVAREPERPLPGAVTRAVPVARPRLWAHSVGRRGPPAAPAFG